MPIPLSTKSRLQETLPIAHRPVARLKRSSTRRHQTGYILDREHSESEAGDLTYTLKQFIQESESIVTAPSSESQKLVQLKPRLEQLIQSSSVPTQAFTPRQDRFAMNLLHMPSDKSYSIIGGVWKPGQTTPIHDHLTWALIGTYKGQEREALYNRTDDKTKPKYAKLEKVSEQINTTGHVTVLSHTGIHKVDNISQEPAQSIHVYGRDIGNTERHSYDPLTGEIGRFVSGYCNVLRDDEPY